MKVLKCIFTALAALLCAITVPAQQLPPLPIDKSIEIGELGCGAIYYIVKAPLKKGYASIALVQKGDTLSEAKQVSSAFLARMGVGPREEGFIYERDGSTVYRFQDIPFYRKEVADSMLLYTFSQMAQTSAPQAIIVTGDVEPTEELKKKMEIFSMMVHKLDAPAPEPKYQWNPNQPLQLDFTKGPNSTISVTYAGKRIPELFMNTAQALVTDIFGMEFLALMDHRLRKDLAREGISVKGIDFSSLRSCDHRGDERYTVSVSVEPGREDDAIRVIGRTIGSIDAKGVGVQEFADAKETLKPGLLSKAAKMYDNLDRCIAHYLLGANLAPAGAMVHLFARKNLSEDAETRLFNKYASALLAGEDNLTLALSAKDTLDPAEALLLYNANYKNALAVPEEGDYTWHRADSAGLEFTPPKVKIQKEKLDPVSGGTLWTFSNGIRVIFKEIRGSRMFNYSFVLNGGLTQIPGLEEGEGEHIGPMLALYDVGGIKADSFRDLLQVNGLTMNADVLLNSLIINGEAPSGKLAFMLKTMLALSHERVPNREAFELYGMGTSTTQDKAESYYNDRFARFNDGIIIIAGDLDAGVVKKLLTRYLGGFGVQKGTLPRRAAEIRQRSGAVTVIGDSGPSRIHVKLEAPMAVTSDNFYASYVAADALKLALIRELWSYGFTADVDVSPITQPQERFSMEISCFPAFGAAIPEPERAITAVRAAIAKASRTLPDAVDVAAWKAALLETVKVKLNSPQGFTAAQEARYALNKDINSRYAESISAVTPEKVRSFLSTISSGGAVEYIVP